MPAAELGTKQVCPTCQSKFYDLTRRPAHCPKCGTDFDPEEALRTRRNVRSRVGAADEPEEKDDQVAETEEHEEEEEEEVTPEIDAAADEPAVLDDDDGSPAPAEEIGVEISEDPDLEEESDDVPFLEDEDEDDISEDDLGLPEDADDRDR